MRLNEFLERHATSDLVEVILSAINHSEQSGTTTNLAQVVDALLDDHAVIVRVADPKRTHAKAGLSTQISSFGPAAPRQVGEIDFDFSALVDPATMLAKDLGAERVTPLTLLATLLTAGIFKDS